MAFWSGAKLRDDGATLKIVDGFDEKQIDCSAYTLRMGAEAYVTPSHGCDPRQNTKIDLTALQTVQAFGRPVQTRGGSFVIPPGQFAFLLTEEVIRMPTNAMGFISLRSSGIKFKGLINVSGFHVDPGFTGNLVYSVFNAGPSSIHIKRGDDLFKLWVTDLVGPIEQKFDKSKDDPQLQISAKLISEVAYETYSLKSLSDRLDSLVIQMRIVWAVAAAIGIVLAIVIGYYQIVDGREERVAQNKQPLQIEDEGTTQDQAPNKPPVVQADKRKE